MLLENSVFNFRIDSMFIREVIVSELFFCFVFFLIPLDELHEKFLLREPKQFKMIGSRKGKFASYKQLERSDK